MYRSIGMPEFYQKTKRQSLAIIDIRETHEYRFGHVPQAVNFPLSELGSAYGKLDTAKEYYIICQSGSRSTMACNFLAAKGYRVVNVMGGTSAWLGGLE